MHCRILRVQRVPPGESALRLYIDDDELCAGIIEQRCDGRLSITAADQHGIDGIVPTIAQLLRQRPALLYVVIEDDAYWPDSFPKISASA